MERGEGAVSGAGGAGDVGNGSDGACFGAGEPCADFYAVYGADGDGEVMGYSDWAVRKSMTPPAVQK